MSKIISIVIPTYNRRKLLQKCLDNLMHQNYPKDKYEIIVIDDGSSDETEEFMEIMSTSITNLKYLKQENQGHSVARNLGFSQARGEIIVSLDDDCIPCSDWLGKIVKEFELHPDISIICGRILNPTNSKVAWADFLINFSSWITLRPKDDIRIAYIGNTAYRRKAIKGFQLQEDGKHFGYRDSMFNYKIIKKGYKARYCPNIKAEHHKWEDKAIKNEKTLFIQQQIYKGRGFRVSGYKIHGKLGYCFIKLPSYCFIIIKSILILLRSINSGLLMKYLNCFDYMLLGLKCQALAMREK